MDKPVFTRTERLDFEMGTMSGYIYPDDGWEFNLNEDQLRDGHVWMMPWHVAYLAKVLPKVVKFYEEQGVDMSPPERDTEDG